MEVRDSTLEHADLPAAKAREALDETKRTAAEQATLDLEKKPAEKAVDDLSCLVCDFRSNWENGLRIHMSRKHSKLDQVDGNSDIDIEDEKYSGTNRYWESGRLGTYYQGFLDANYIIETSDLDEEAKIKEKEKVLQARKIAFGEDFRFYPPWRKQ